MKRVVVYNVEEKKPETSTVHSQKVNQQKQDSWDSEKRKRAIKTIENASELSKIVKSIEALKLNDPQTDGYIIKEAVETISNIVEEMKLEFKKDYWE
jgi:hypothetical protein